MAITDLIPWNRNRNVPAPRQTDPFFAFRREMDRLFLNKEATLIHDRRVRDRAQAILDGSEDASLQAIHTSLDGLIFDLFEKRIRKFVARNNSHWERMRRFPKGNRSSIYTAAGLALVQLGAILSGRPTVPAESKPLLEKPTRNHWVDVRIVAASAYANVLVSNDEGQWVRARFVRDHYSFGPQILTLEEWLQDA